jgi:hypothetical protein
MGTYGIQIKVVVLPWLVCWARRAGTRDFLSCLGCSGQPSTTYFFLTVHYFNFCVPVSQQPGQAVVQGCLSLKCVSPVLLITCTCDLHRRPCSVYFSQCKHLFVLLSRLSCMIVKDVRGCATNSGSPEILSMAHFVQILILVASPELFSLSLLCFSVYA